MTATETTNAGRETLGFQAEVKQLLQLMIHSLYSNREIFLRELISNASDACDKLRFEALHNERAVRGRFRAHDPRRLRPRGQDADRRRQRRRHEPRRGDHEPRHDRQVGHARVLLAADRRPAEGRPSDRPVRRRLLFVVHRRRQGDGATRAAPARSPDQGVRWESDGGGEFAIEMMEKAARGTEITLHLREGQDDLLAGSKLRSIIRKYSDHIVQPILMPKEEWKDGKQEKLDERGDRQPGLRAVGARRRTTSATSSTRSSTSTSATTSTIRWRGLTRASRAARSTRSCSTSRRARRSTCGTATPATASSCTCAASSSWTMPSSCCRRICASCAASSIRTTCRSTSRARSCRNRRTSRRSAAAARARCSALLEDLAANDKDKYAKFWGEFGRVLKEGVGEDFANQGKIAGLLRFASTHADTADETVSLADYLGRMKEGQDKIYYVTADTFNAAKNSPHLEVFRKKGIEVLLLSDRVDEWVVGHLTEFEGKALVSVAKGGLDLGRARGRGRDARKAKQRGDRARRPRRPDQDEPRRARQGRARDAPADRIAGLPRRRRARHERQPGAPAQGRRSAAARDAKPILEINPKHPVVLRLQGRGQEVRRLGRGAARSGAARRGRPARRSGRRSSSGSTS